MTDEQKVAPELMEALERLMRYAPPEAANDEQVRNSILIYLKLGGERLARQYFQIIQKTFLEKIVLIKKGASLLLFMQQSYQKNINA